MSCGCGTASTKCACSDPMDPLQKVALKANLAPGSKQVVDRGNRSCAERIGHPVRVTASSQSEKAEGLARPSRRAPSDHRLRVIGAFLSGVEVPVLPGRRLAQRKQAADGTVRSGQVIRPVGALLRPDLIRRDELACSTDAAAERSESLVSDGNISKSQAAEPPATELLMAGFSLPASGCGNAAPLLGAAIKALRETGGAVLRPSARALRPRARGCGSLLRAEVRPSSGATRRSAGDVLEDGSDRWEDEVPADASEGTSDTDTVDGSDYGGEPWLAPSTVTLGYRTVSFEVDGAWLSEYLSDFAAMYGNGAVGTTYSHGIVSSIDDTLDLLWHPFRVAAKGSHATFQKLIGCYNLPRTYGPRVTSFTDADAAAPSWAAADKPDLFWHLDWGPAQMVVLYALQLLYTYVEHVEDDRTPEPCEGIRSFMTTLLEDGEATNDSGTTCSLTVSFRNAESGYDYVNAPCKTPVLDCDDGYQLKGGTITQGEPFNDYALYWVSSTSCLSGKSAADSNCDEPWPGTTSNSFGDPDRFGVVTHPIHLHFRGAVCDYILFLARLAMDYALSGALEFWDALALLVDASRLARYALRVISGFSELLVHEIGHVYAGGNHCDSGSGNNLACMEIAARQWGCKVRGVLGLPSRTFSQQNTDGGFPATDDDWDRDAHEHVNLSATFNRWEYCDTVKEGTPGQDARYCSTVCLTHLSADEELDEKVSFLDCAGYTFGY